MLREVTVTLCEFDRTTSDVWTCRRCGFVTPPITEAPIRNCRANGKTAAVAVKETAHYLTCPHRGSVVATVSGTTAGCGCGSSRVDVYRCSRFGEPVLKQAAQRCLEKIAAAAPGYAGRTCRECPVPRIGAYDVDPPNAKRIDVLHLMGEHWLPRGKKMCAAASEINVARKVIGSVDEDSEAIVATGCRVVVIHALEHSYQSTRQLAQRFPRVAFVCVFHGSQNVLVRNPAWPAMQRDFLRLSEELPNVWYATPEPTIPWETLGYRRAVCWPNTLPLESLGELPTIDPPTLLIASRMDIIKALPASIIACGLVARRRPVRVMSIVKERIAGLDAIAEAAGVRIEHEDWREWEGFHDLIRERVSVTVCPSLTDSFNYVAWDSLSQGRPAVGSPTIRYLPPAWQADPNNPQDIADRVLAILDAYDVSSRHARAVAESLAQRQQEAYAWLLERITARLT